MKRSVIWWCGLYFKDAVSVHVLKVMQQRLSIISRFALLVWCRRSCRFFFIIGAAHRSPLSHPDAGSAPKAQRDWRNMKYWTQPVLAVTYWGRAGCLSMPEIDLMIRGSRADGHSTLSSWETVRSSGVSSAESGGVWITQHPSDAPGEPLCVQVCVFAQWLLQPRSANTETRSRSSGRSHTLSSDSSSGLWEREWTLTVCWEVKGHSLNIGVFVNETPLKG